MIRFFLGFLIVFGAVGYIENCSDAGLLAGILVAAAGLGIMSAGTRRVAVVYR
jgi:hypothetical protein